MSDVLTRLDSLVANTNSHGGILKSNLNGNGASSKSKKIRFPEAIVEVIGYGGLYEEDFEEDEKGSPEMGKSKGSSDVSDDEEDREFSSLTRKNTNFNSHLQNLNGESKPMALLGSTKTKNPPLITVRPFSHREISTSSSSISSNTTSTAMLTINKVSPMIKGVVKKSLGSDGDEEETSDSSEDSTGEEPSPKPPQVSSARLSFLNGTISYDSPREEGLLKTKEDSPPRYITTSVIKNVHIKTSISRKPPILKEKPKITSRALLERRKSSEDEEDEDDIDDDVISSSSSDVCSYDVNKKDEDEQSDEQEEEEESVPIAAPRKLSIHSMIPFHSPGISFASESSKIHIPESENKVQSSIKLLSYSKSEVLSSPPKAPIKLPLEAKSSFELNRASIANALEFNRIDKSIRTSTKRKAPLAPALEEISLVESAPPSESSSKPGVVPKPPPLPPVNLFKNISLAINPSEPESSSMTSAISQRVSIFTTTKETLSNPDYIESSFTAGKPIKTVPPPEPVAFLVKDEDEVRKWKEKKQPYPPSPDISGEILGSSKKSQHNFLTAAANMVINKAEQQIGAAIDESVKLKKLSEKKFSFKKFFHGSSNSLKKLNNSSGGDSESSSCSSSSSGGEKSCLDKEHEREILERERKSMGKGGGILRKTRPEIIHPCTFSIDDDAAPATNIEVVKIIPGEGMSRSVGKQTIARSLSSDPQLCLKEQPLSVLKSNTETDSISSSSTVDTEYSNKSEITISSMSYGSESESTSSSGKRHHKPAPPPRRHSLENFGDPSPLRNSRLGLDKVHEEEGTKDNNLGRSDEDFRNSLLIIPPQDENEYSGGTHLDRSLKAMIEMNNEALRILFEKFNSKPLDTDIASKLNEIDLCLSDFDVSKSSRLTTRIGSFYEASWRGHSLTVLLSALTDLSQSDRISGLPPPLTFFTEEHLLPSSFIVDSIPDEQVVVYVYSPLKLESLESFSTAIEDSDRAKKFFALQLLHALEKNPGETDPLSYFMARRISDSGVFSYKLISLSGGSPGTPSGSVLDLLQVSPESCLEDKRREIERQLFAEGSRLHLQKAEALTKLVSKDSPTLSVVEEYQLKFLLSSEEEQEEELSPLDSGVICKKDNEITYVYNV